MHGGNWLTGTGASHDGNGQVDALGKGKSLGKGQKGFKGFGKGQGKKDLNSQSK